VMAMDTIRLGDQVLNVVAEQSLSQALSLALSALAITGILTVAALILAGSVGLTAVRRIARPIEILDTTAQAITAGDLSRQTEVIGRDELGHLAQAFNTMTARLRETLSGLEQQVTDRTLDAERRTQQIQAAADVGKAAASIRNLDELLTRVAYLISERFGFYHAGVFLLDPQGEHVILHAASSPGGQRMLERGHRLRVGEAGSSLAAGENTAAGIVGHVASTMEARIALDVGQDATFFDNPDLPDTRSEMALPLMAGGRLLGVLDVQSTKAGAFGEEDIGVLQVLADQVAVAIENAQLFAETQRTLDVERRAYGQVSRVAWRDLLRLQRARGYRCDPQGVFAIAAGDQPGAAPAPELVGEPAPQDGATLLLPIQVRDHTLGFVRLRKPDEAHAWTAEEVALMDLLAEQLGVALESARLYADTQRRVAREQLVGQVTARIRETLDVETVLQTAIREMGSALGIPKIEVRLGRQLARPGDGRDEGKEGNGHVGLD
jgi:GAF domain-containing protein/HAMP domain-containing protein